MSSTFQLPKKCEYCGQLSLAKTTMTKYCDKKCNSKHYKQLKRVEKINASIKQYFAAGLSRHASFPLNAEF